MFNLTYNNKSFNQRPEDNYVNLGQLCATHGKKLSHWKDTNASKAYIEALSISTGISAPELIQSKMGNEGTWGHPKIAEEILAWIQRSPSKSKGKSFETKVQKSLANKLNGTREVPIKSGIIDILTSDEVIEVKEVKKWKAAVGQVLVYQLEYPDHTARIHLFGECSTEYKQMIISFASQLNITATFE